MRPKMPEPKVTEEEKRARSEAALLRFYQTQNSLREETRMYSRGYINRRSLATGRPIKGLTIGR